MSTGGEPSAGARPEPSAGPTEPEEEHKRLFVLTADLVGYSELVVRDARGGIASLMETRAVLAGAIADRRGQVVSTPGDFVLAVFPDAEDAVVAASEGQQRLMAHARARVGERPIVWRTGIAYGDVYEVGRDIYGHAVNVAARIQALGRPGDILISEDVKRQLPATAGLAMESLGARRLKNIAEPIEIHRVLWPGLAALSVAPVRPAISADLLKHLTRPVLKIDKFAVLEQSDHKALLARAIEEEIHIVLSRLSGSIRVIEPDRATGSTPVNYSLRASLQSSGRHLRLIARLISLATGATVWAERYDCDLRHGFRLQDEVAREIVAALQFSLTEGEQAHFWRRGTKSGLAWEQFQLGRDHEGRYTRHGHRSAKQHYAQALRLDPTYLSALVALGFCHLDEVRLGWSEDDQAALAQAATIVEQAQGLNPRHPDVLSLEAFLKVMQGHAGQAIEAMNKAVAGAGLNAEIIAYQGALHDLLGDFPLAIRSYKRALSLSPHGKPWIGANLGLSCLAVGDAADAVRIFEQVIRDYPDYVRAWIGLSVALLRQYRSEEAQQAAARVLELDPLFTVERWGRSRPFNDEALLTQFMADLREAGLSP